MSVRDAEYRPDGRFVITPVRLQKDPDADPFKIAVYAAIRAFADYGNGSQEARVGDDQIASLAHCSERKVRECRTWLEARGWIEKRRTKRANCYVVHTVPHRKDSQAAPHAGRDSQAAPRAACHPAPRAARKILRPSESLGSSEKDQNTYVAEGGDESPGKASNEQIRELHDHFNTERQRLDPTGGLRDLKLTDDRRRKYRARLRTWSVDELKRAITNALGDEFYRGKNDAGRRYDHPETILKNDGAVDRHLDVGEGKRREREGQAREQGRGAWGTLVSLRKRGLSEDELRDHLSPSGREAYLVVRSDLERALVEDLDLRPVRDRFLAAYSERGARGP